MTELQLKTQLQVLSHGDLEFHSVRVRKGNQFIGRVHIVPLRMGVGRRKKHFPF